MLGEVVPIRAWIRTDAQLPIDPDAAPRALIYSATTRVATEKIPAIDQNDQTALFGLQLCLDTKFSPGRYSVIYQFQIGSTNRAYRDSFDVVAGGDAAGRGNSLFYFQGSQRDVILMRTDQGAVRRMFNPRL